MSFALPKPKIVSRDGKPEEVILSYAEWQRIVAVLGEPSEYDEDADDIAAVNAARAEDHAFAAQLAVERGEAIETAIPLEVVAARLDGAHPLKAWREYRGMTQLHLCHRSGVGRDLIAQIETRRKQGSIETLDRLARALAIPMEALIEAKSADATP